MINQPEDLPYHEALKIRLAKMTNEEWLAEYNASPLSGEVSKQVKESK